MEYCNLAEQLFSMIDAELKRAESKKANLSEVYPKLVICYEFFRYIRGEFFHSSRPSGLDCQKRMYQLEDQINERLGQLRKQLDTKDEKTSYHLDLCKKLFE